jgi:di/tricarboxylate transporter
MLEMLFVVSVLLGAAILFALDRFRMDLVGFGALTLLLVGGVLTVPEALAGFADPSVHMIAGLFVVGAAVFETGLADRFGNMIERLGGKDPKRLLATILLATASLSAFLSSTGTVALMVPVVTSLGRKAQLSPSKLMIPLAYATLLGGLLTLIATAPNLVVATALEHAGYAPFAFFDFTGPGLCLVLAGTAFLVWVGPSLLPDRVSAGDDSKSRPSAEELWQRYGLAGWMAEFEVQPDSPLVGRSIAASAVRTEYGVAIFAVRTGEPARSAAAARADRVLLAGDIVTAKGAPPLLEAFCERARLREVGRPQSLPEGLVVAELLLPPGSSLIGKTVRATRLRSRFDVTVMAVFRTREVLRDSVAQTTLHVGDLLLLLGTARAVVKLRDELSDTILVTESEELRKSLFRLERAPHALGVVILMLVALTFNLTAPVTVVISAALAMVVLGCIDTGSAERSVKWESLLLIATFLPMTTALTKVGVIDGVVHGLVGVLGSVGPYAILAAIFVLTAGVGTVISNTATAVLVAPVAVSVAKSLGLLPHPLLMTVAIASSCAFLTPVSSPVNLLVINPGGYRFGDFARIGAPLLVLIGLLTLVIVPLFFPFH